MQKFATDTTTGLVSRARNGTGFSVSFVGSSNISPAPTQGRSDLAPVFGLRYGINVHSLCERVRKALPDKAECQPPSRKSQQEKMIG